VIAIVAGLTWFGHRGREIFAALTISFIALGILVLLRGLDAHPLPADMTPQTSTTSGLWAVVLAFPVAMALATDIEAPSSAIAQLGQLDDAGRTRFGRITLWLTVAIVGIITLGLTAQAVRLGVGEPASDGTQIANLARASTPAPVFAAFQVVTALLLLSAASSSFQAGPGLLKALSARPTDTSPGILPVRLERTNRYHTPYWGVLFFTVVSVVLIVATGGRDQHLVLFYAVAVFLSFLAGLLAMTRLAPLGAAFCGRRGEPGRRDRGGLHPLGESAPRCTSSICDRHAAHRGSAAPALGALGSAHRRTRCMSLQPRGPRRAAKNVKKRSDVIAVADPVLCVRRGEARMPVCARRIRSTRCRIGWQLRVPRCGPTWRTPRPGSETL
jgi:hypothetical protein